MQHLQKKGVGVRSEALLFYFTNHCSLTTAHFLLNGRGTCQPCRAVASRSGAARPSLYHRRRQNSRRRCPSLHRAAASRWDCRTLRKFSGHPLSQTCNRLPRETISPARNQDVLAHPTSHPASPPFLFELCPATQSVVHSRACARLRRAAHRRISLSPFRSFRFSPPARHN